MRKVTSSLDHHVVADLCLVEGAILPEPRTALDRMYLGKHENFSNFLLGINNRERRDRWKFNSDGVVTVPNGQINWGSANFDSNKNCAMMSDDISTGSINPGEKLVYPITCDGPAIQGKQCICEKNEGIFFFLFKINKVIHIAKLWFSC